MQEFFKGDETNAGGRVGGLCRPPSCVEPEMAVDARSANAYSRHMSAVNWINSGVKLWLLAIGGILTSSSAVHAEDKNGLRVSITKKTLDRADGAASHTREIDRTMALKATVKNISMKEMPEGTIECVILIKRWGMSESGSLERYSKSLPLGTLKTAAEQELLVGDYKIGGHMHGTSTMHVDQLAGWKLVITHDSKKTEFLSTSGFEALNKRARDSSR